MQIIIHNSSDLNPTTVEVINEKIGKLETFYDRIERAEVFLKEDDGSAANGHTVEARLHIPGNDLFADFTDPSIEKGITEVAEALRRQLMKHKAKHTHRHL